LEPVRIATQRYSSPDACAGTTILTALLELIFVRSLAMPENACAAITYGTTSQLSGTTASIASATICTARPPSSVDLRPNRAAR
jgi:hypothetical protein